MGERATEGLWGKLGVARAGLLGFGLWWAWWDMFRVSDSHILPVLGDSSTDVDRLAVAIGFWLCAFLLWRASKRIRMLCLHRSWLVVSVVAATVLSAVIYASLFGLFVPCGFAVRFLVGAAGTPLFFAWFEYYSMDVVKKPGIVVPLCLVLDAAILALFVVFHLFVPYPVLAVVHLLLLPASLALLLARVPKDEKGCLRTFGGVEAKLSVRLPWGLMAALAVFGAIFGFVLNAAPDFAANSVAGEHGPLFLEIAGMVAGSVLFLALGRRGVEGGYLSLRWVTVPFMVLSLLSLLTVAGFSPVITKVFLWMGYEYLDLIMMTLYIWMARELGVLPLNVHAQGQSADTFGIMVGMAAGVAFGNVFSQLSATAVSAIVTILVLVVMVTALFVMTDRNIATFWGLLKKPPRGEADARSQFEERLGAFAAEYGLTPREREIVGMLVQQQRPVLIAEKLVISRETVRSHISRIYVKCQCHSQIELVRMFEDYERS